jgi:hypothetical protein
MIDYEALAQEAMRGVVRTVLARVAKAGGLPGDHHFYISFDTQAPGVSLSKRLREKYPEEMTIVLQHRFWDLAVSEERFEVKLTFDGIPEKLVVPFLAIKVFFDPSVRYGLQFEAPGFGPDALPHSQTGRGDAVAPSGLDVPVSAGTSSLRGSSRPAGDRKPRAARKRADKGSDAPAPLAALPGPAKPTPVSGSQAGGAGPRPVEPPPVPPASGAEIVRLDSFRKK